MTVFRRPDLFEPFAWSDFWLAIVVVLILLASMLDGGRACA